MRTMLVTRGSPSRVFGGASPSSRPALRPLRYTAARACADPAFVDVCMDKTCSKQNSAKTLEYFREMAQPNVTVDTCGCLGNCGEGPNINILPDDTLITGVDSPEVVAGVLENHCAGIAADKALAEMQARQRGNEALAKGDLEAAEGLYSEAIEVSPTAAALAARSGVKLALGNKEGALADAEAAYGASPEWTGGYIRAADAWEALGDSQAALAACSAAYQIDPDLMEDEDFKDRVTWLQRVG